MLGLGCATLLGPGAAWAAPAPPPKMQGDPIITGVAQEGATLTASAKWEKDPPAIVEWAWLRCSASGPECQDIQDASDATYVPTATDVGRTLRVRAMWSHDDKPAQKRSAPTEVMLSAAPTTPPTPGATPPTPGATPLRIARDDSRTHAAAATARSRPPAVRVAGPHP